MNDTNNCDITQTQGEKELKPTETGKENTTENASLIGAGDSCTIQTSFPSKPRRRSPSEAPRPPPRTKSRRARARSTPPPRPIAPCRKEDDKLPRQPQRRPPYNPELNPFKDDMEEELAENEKDKTGNASGNTDQDEERDKMTRDYDKSLNHFTEDSHKEKKKNIRKEYPESLNPFAGDSDEEENVKTIHYNEALNPFAPPPRPPLPVFKQCPRPTAQVPPEIATSFRQRLSQYFFKKEEKVAARTSLKENQQKIKWICIQPTKEALPDHLCLKKGQKVTQTGPVNADGYAYGYIKKGILKTKNRGYFPLASVNPVENK